MKGVKPFEVHDEPSLLTDEFEEMMDLCIIINLKIKPNDTDDNE